MSKESRRRRREERKRRQSEPLYRSARYIKVAFVNGSKAVGGFLKRMFLRARLLVAFPFLMVGIVLVLPKISLEFFVEAWDMFKRGSHEP